MTTNRNFLPQLSESPLSYRIGLAEQRLKSYPLDSLDFIMIDMERPENRIRMAQQCMSDLTGRLLEFLSEAHMIRPGSDDTQLNALFDRIIMKTHNIGFLRRMPSYYKYTNSSEAYRYMQTITDQWLYDLEHEKTHAEKMKKIVYPNNCSSAIEPLAYLYSQTGDERYIELAKIQLEYNMLPLDNAHSHALLTLLRGLQAMAVATGDESWMEIPNKYRTEILKQNMPYADGSVSEGFPKSTRNEGCSIGDWIMFNLRHGFIYDDDEAYEMAELSLYNGLFFNQFVTGGFGHRDYGYRGYQTKIQEAWWCCTQTGGLAMCRFAQHAVQLRKNKIRVNFMIPGTYTLSDNGHEIKVTVATSFPDLFRATVEVTGTDLPVEFRIPTYVKNAKITSHDRGDCTVYNAEGIMGHYVSPYGDGYTVKYGPLVLAPLSYSWLDIPLDVIESEVNVPKDYQMHGVADENMRIVLPKPDENGFLPITAGMDLPEWFFFDDGNGAHLGTHFHATANLDVISGGERQKMCFQPMCAATSALVVYNVPMVFNIEQE